MPIPSSDFFIETANYETDLGALRAVREPVFVLEQNVPIELEWDDLDPKSTHVLARDAQTGQPIGTGRLTPERKIGRMAVLKEWRGRGVGDALLVRLLDIARERGLDQVSLHAQVSALDFYARHGFEPEGERFMEAGIEHQTMRRRLDRPSGPERASAERRPEQPEREFTAFVDCRDGTLEILRAARHQLTIYTRDLDPLLYGEPAALDEIRRIGLSGRGAEIRVLVQDPAAAQQAKSPVIALLQRLSSAVQIRQPKDEVDLQFAGAFLLNDQGGYLSRPIGSRFEGYVSSHGPGRHRQLADYFRQVWERAQPADELRQMRL